jgi:hemoglobin
MRRNAFVPLASALTLAWVVAVPAESQKGGTNPTPTSLYSRLGGYDGITRFVDTAFPRVASDPQLRRLFQGHSRDSQIRQRQLIVDALCQATGGPCAYTGRPMKPVHAGLAITSSDWTVFTGILGAALEELKVAPAERKDLIGLLERQFKPDVVEAP